MPDHQSTAAAAASASSPSSARALPGTNATGETARCKPIVLRVCTSASCSAVGAESTLLDLESLCESASAVLPRPITAKRSICMQACTAGPNARLIGERVHSGISSHAACKRLVEQVVQRTHHEQLSIRNWLPIAVDEALDYRYSAGLPRRGLADRLCDLAAAVTALRSIQCALPAPAGLLSQVLQQQGVENFHQKRYEESVKCFESALADGGLQKRRWDRCGKQLARAKAKLDGAKATVGEGRQEAAASAPAAVLAMPRPPCQPHTNVCYAASRQEATGNEDDFVSWRLCGIDQVSPDCYELVLRPHGADAW
eukprot:SAG31_NODE_10602_length_1118_cov_1.698724_1_plen_312_part_10